MVIIIITFCKEIEMKKLLSGLMILLLVAVSCDDDGGSTTNNSSGGMTVEQYCNAEAELTNKWCDYYASCCSADDLSSDNFRGVKCSYGEAIDPQECIDYYNDSIANNIFTFNGEDATACLNEQDDETPEPPTSCTGTMYAYYFFLTKHRMHFDSLPSCMSMLTGKLQEGEECRTSKDCADGLTCFNDANSDFVCQQISAQYGNCDFDTNCEFGLYCIDHSCNYPGTAMATCMWPDDCVADYTCSDDYVCVPLKHAGQSCDGRDCDWFSACYTDVCEAYASDGTGCTYDFECMGRCDGSTCVSICGGTQ
jgi:hypothetical protein